MPMLCAWAVRVDPSVCSAAWQVALKSIPCHRKSARSSRRLRCKDPLKPPSLTACCHSATAFARHFVVIAPLPLARPRILVHHRCVTQTLCQAVAPARGGTSPSSATADLRFGHLPICDLAIFLPALLNPSLSLLDIAAAHNLTLDQLTTLMARPDIAEQLAALHSAAALRVRIVAAQHLPRAVEALGTIINAHLNDDDLPTLDKTNFRHMVFRQRRTEMMRRAASTILRLANFHPPSRVSGLGGADVPSASRATDSRGSARESVPLNSPPLRAATVTNQPATVPSPAAQRRTIVAGGERGSPSDPPEASSVRSFARGAQRPEGDPRTAPRRSFASRLLAACGTTRAPGDP